MIVASKTSRNTDQLRTIRYSINVSSSDQGDCQGIADVHGAREIARLASVKVEATTRAILVHDPVRTEDGALPAARATLLDDPVERGAAISLFRQVRRAVSWLANFDKCRVVLAGWYLPYGACRSGASVSVAAG